MLVKVARLPWLRCFSSSGVFEGWGCLGGKVVRLVRVVLVVSWFGCPGVWVVRLVRKVWMVRSFDWFGWFGWLGGYVG
jgi:hypothetical protein